jgi:NADH-quinone oxidoreductase subunit C
MVTLEIKSADLLKVCNILKSKKEFDFSQLIDLAGIDYFAYGHEEWETKKVTTSGFSRGRNINKKNPKKKTDSPSYTIYYRLTII